MAATPSIAKDIDLTLDVIGFDIRKGSSEEKQLADTAAAGVGKYYPVARPEDLAAIFTQVTTGYAAGGGGGIVLRTQRAESPADRPHRPRPRKPRPCRGHHRPSATAGGFRGGPAGQVDAAPGRNEDFRPLRYFLLGRRYKRASGSSRR